MFHQKSLSSIKLPYTHQLSLKTSLLLPKPFPIIHSKNRNIPTTPPETEHHPLLPGSPTSSHREIQMDDSEDGSISLEKGLTSPSLLSCPRVFVVVVCIDKSHPPPTSSSSPSQPILVQPPPPSYANATFQLDEQQQPAPL